jgi:protein O-GlcNAc transferase
VLCSRDVLESVKAQLADTATEWVPLSDRLTEAVEQTAGAKCSLLYHRKIGADGLNYLLPFARPAPIQCRSWGTHLTSGVPGVDYYLSSAYMEREDADQDYSENLVRLQTIPSFEPRLPDPPPARRVDFGLPERGSLFLCPQRLAKFHPDQDEMLLRILDAEPEAHLVILSGRNPHVLDRLLDRFSRVLGKAAERIVVLPPQKPVALRQLLSLGDALLDMRHYSVSLMAYDTFAVNLPVVTLPGPIKVSRYAFGFYRYMGIQGAVASDPDQYVQLALRLGTDADFRHALRREIAQAKEILFEDSTVVRQHELFFQQALNNSSP